AWYSVDMPLGIDIIACPNEPDTAGNCATYRHPRRYRLDDINPCSPEVGVFVQRVTVCATCTTCPGDLPDDDCFVYYEEVPVAPQSTPWAPITSECDFFHWASPGCGDGTKGELLVTADVRYFCMTDFSDGVNPFNGARSGVIPVSSLPCHCITSWDTGGFRYRLYSQPPDWWDNHRAKTSRTAIVKWDCCEGTSPTDVEYIP
ncbi:MAG: hypothetical protein KJZ68_16220, partial [Phycisphaerales bacterium]|nr:hypothetical protein [Phycisphaerales bacterium]